MPDMSASVSLAVTHLIPLAEFDENKVTPGVLGFIVFAVMGLAVWGLMKSMNKHMSKVDFHQDAASGSGGEAGTKGAPASAPKPQRG
ncbi:hypothetical protein NGF19_24455 [Streptomyces sp. RY43-2]|uniref:Ribosome associated membrane protein RAMP4 n=1 Tax=Streptomyces macrolidinus TaxID=2952607 RepID=A0ABT0ZJX3_9ACTN|nr:hypothetical protein [Streptomyces macrolidinus]MCN9243895.1 hypothetical protein [Streptomyces macrolidinus]